MAPLTWMVILASLAVLMWLLGPGDAWWTAAAGAALVVVAVVVALAWALGPLGSGLKPFMGWQLLRPGMKMPLRDRAGHMAATFAPLLTSATALLSLALLLRLAAR